MYRMTDEEFYEVYGRMPRRTQNKKKKRIKIYWHRIIIALIILALIVFGIVKLVKLIVGKISGGKGDDSSSSVSSAVNDDDDYYAEPKNKEVDADYQGIDLTVCIDPAHGGFDNGAEGEDGRLEKDDVLNIAMALKAHLEGCGVNVIMTRTDDTYSDVKARSSIANEQGADLFISIHRSSSDIYGSDMHGFEADIHNAEPEIDKAFALKIMTKLEEIGISENKGVRGGYPNDSTVNYEINELTKMPSVLLDMGYVTSSIDNQLLDANLEAYARAIGNGIIESAEEQGIIDENGARKTEGQLLSDKPAPTVETPREQTSESEADDSSEAENEYDDVYGEQNYDLFQEEQQEEPLQTEEDHVYTDDGVGYYTEPMMTE